MRATRAIRWAALFAGACLAFSVSASDAPDGVEVDPAPLERSERNQTVSYARAIGAARASIVSLRADSGSALGLGVIVSENGYVLASAAAIGSLDTVEARMADGATREAKVVGADTEIGIAALKIDAAGLPGIVVGDSEELEVGDVVFAFGSLAENGVEVAAAFGIVSALPAQDESPKLIWTDADAGPGGAGGALIDAKGRLVGIVLIGGGGDSRDVGSLRQAIPVNDARAFLVRLARPPEASAEQGESARAPGRFFEGVVAAPVDGALRERFNLAESVEGIVVIAVSPKSPYASALPVGIVISKVNGAKVSSIEDAAAELAPGKNTLQIAYRGVYRWIVVEVDGAR